MIKRAQQNGHYRKLAGVAISSLALLTTCIVSVSAQANSRADRNSVTVRAGKVDTVLRLRGGGELIIPFGSLRSGVRVVATYESPPEASWRQYRPIGAQVHFSTVPKTNFAGPLLLEYRVPANAYRDAARYGFYEVATLDARRHVWRDVASSYDPTTHMVITRILHFSWWSDVKEAVDQAQIVTKCIPEAFTWVRFLRCLVENNVEETGDTVISNILEVLMPKACWSDVLVTGVVEDGDPASIFAAAANDPACIGTAVSNGLPQPTVTSVSPNSGSTAGGEVILLTGSTVGSATHVSFGGVSASFTYPLNSPNSLSVTAPPHGAGVVNISVSDVGGNSNATSASEFTYVAPTSPPTTAPPSSPPAGTNGATLPETPGSVVHTWTDYSDAGGTEGPTIPSNETVQVACRVQGFTVADGDTWWYLIASSPWDDSYYGSADAFYNNGSTSGSLVGTPYFDPNVPVCG